MWLCQISWLCFPFGTTSGKWLLQSRSWNEREMGSYHWVKTHVQWGQEINLWRYFGHLETFWLCVTSAKMTRQHNKIHCSLLRTLLIKWSIKNFPWSIERIHKLAFYFEFLGFQVVPKLTTTTKRKSLRWWVWTKRIFQTNKTSD